MSHSILPNLKTYLMFFIILTTSSLLAEDIFISTQPGKAVIDGKLKEQQWINATKINNFYKLNSNRVKADQQTEVKFWSNQKSLFIALICHEKNMTDLKAKLKRRDAALWNDDCVEIFVSSQVNAEPYYQLVVNTLGTQADIKISGNGMKKNLSWNGKWKARTSINKDNYVVEIELPLGSLDKPGSETWRIAFARENKASKENSSWPAMRGGFHEPQKYAILNGMKLDRSCFLLTFDNAQFIFENSDNGVISGKTQIILNCEENFKQAKLSLDISNNSGFRIKKVKTITLTKGINTIQTPVVFLNEGNYSSKVSIKTAKGSSAKHNWKFNVISNPFVAELDFPRYRNMIMDSMPQTIKLSVKARTKKLFGKKYQLTLLNSKGENIGETASLRFEPDTGSINYKLPAQMPYGEYSLIVKFNGFKQAIKLSKVPKIKGKSEVYFDEHNNMVVNDKKIFPFGFYYGTPDLKSYKSNGYNMVVSLNERAFDTLNKEKIYYIGYARHLIHSLLSSPKQNKLNIGAIKKTAALFARENSYVTGWYVADEPELICKNNALYRKAFKKLRELSPRIPLMTTHNAFYGLKMDADLADIISMDPYLGFERNKKDPLIPYNRISIYMNDAVKSVRNRKPVWAVLQCYASGYYNGDPKTTRYPTIQEIRTMSYLAVIHGARGIIYWYNSPLKAKKLWPAMKLFGKEFKFLSPFLLAPTTSKYKITDSIHYLVKKIGGKTCIIAVNPEGKTIQTKINSGSKNILYNVLSENRTVKTANGKIKDSFPPYSTHIYCSFETPEGKFAKVLKDYSLEDSLIGTSGPKNLANFWYGAVPSPSSTSPYRRSCEAIDGAIASNWVSHKDKTPYYEVKLYKKGHIRKIIFSSKEMFNKLEIYANGKWTVVKPEKLKEYYKFWNDDTDKWEKTFEKPNLSRPYKCIEISVNYPNTEKIRVSGAKSIRELQAFE